MHLTMTDAVMFFFLWLWFVGPLVVWLRDKSKRRK